MAQFAAAALPANSAAIANAPTIDGIGCVGDVGVGQVGDPVFTPGATVLTVGVGKEYATIAQAVGASQDGDVILVDAGTYTNDFSIIRSNITLIGVGGMVDMVATIPPTDLKGIITVDDSATIENFSFSGSAINDYDGGNGAGIRYEGGDMVLRNDVFFDNQNGILGAPVLGLPSNTIVLDHDTFDQNGSGSGYTHNCYIGAVDKLTVSNSVFAEANVGHELKSRALVSDIENNIFYDGPNADPSYDIDLPNGGKDIVAHNTIEKGPNAQNYAMVHFAGEGIPYSGSSLLVQDNAFIDDKGVAIGVLNQSAISAKVTGNAFVNFDASRLVNGPATLTGNVDGNGTAFIDGSLVGVLPGSTQIYTDADPHTLLMQDTSIMAVEGGAGLLTVAAGIGHVVAIGGAGGLDFSEATGSGGNSITTAAGSTNIVTVSGQDLIDSEGNDTITTGTCDVTAQINGVATIYSGSGDNQWSINGQATLYGGGGSDPISLGAGASLALSGTEGYVGLSSNGGSATLDMVVGGYAMNASIVGGSVLLRTYGNAMHVSTGGGTQGAVMRFASGDVAVSSVGPDVVYAGAGNDSVVVSGAARVYAGAGQLSVFGRGDAAGASVYGAGGTVTLDGDSGNITYYGGALASTVVSNLSRDAFVGGAGHMTILGGSGETIQGGAGGVTFTANGGGANTITTLARSKNVLSLGGADTVNSYGIDNITTTGSLNGTLHGNATVNGGGNTVSLTLSGNDRFVGSGYDSLWLTAGAVANVAVTGFATAYANTSTLTYRGGSDGATVTVVGAASVQSGAGAGVAVITNQGAASSVTLGAGTATVYSQANDQLRLGNANAAVQTHTAGVEIWGGSGTSSVEDRDWTVGDTITIHGGSGALSYLGSGALTFIGGSGSAVIDGQAGALSVTGGSGAIRIAGGNQGLHFVGGSGRATIDLTAGGGTITFGSGGTTVNQAAWGNADIYTIARGHPPTLDTINGFRIGTDSLILNGVALRTVSIVNGSANLGFSDKTHVVLTGITDVTHLF